MSFTYLTDIPLATNNPSVDQPNMKQNTNAINNWVNVDHVGFNTTVGGQHLQVTFNSNNASPSIAAGAVAVETVNAGSASSASQLFFTNTNATFQLSSIAAWGMLGGGATSTSQAYNLASVVKNTVGDYSITLTSGAVNSDAYGIIVNCQRSGGNPVVTNSVNTGTGTFNVYFNQLSNGAAVDVQWTFIVLQL